MWNSGRWTRLTSLGPRPWWAAPTWPAHRQLAWRPDDGLRPRRGAGGVLDAGRVAPRRRSRHGAGSVVSSAAEAVAHRRSLTSRTRSAGQRRPRRRRRGSRTRRHRSASRCGRARSASSSTRAARVEADRDGAQRRHGGPGQQEVRVVGQHQREPVAGPQPARAERARRAPSTSRANSARVHVSRLGRRTAPRSGTARSGSRVGPVLDEPADVASAGPRRDACVTRATAGA